MEKTRMETYYMQWLQSQEHLSGKSARKVMELYPDAEELLRDGREHWEGYFCASQAKILWEHVRETGSVENMREQYEKLCEKGIFFVHERQKEYPQRLRDIPDAPLGLYYRGKLPQREGIAVAVIGARDCSEYGAFVAKNLGRFLGERGISVISGMARGIDGISQLATLEAGGDSYAVLGCGVDVCYPASNRELYDRLLARGGILSAYPPGTKPLGSNFPPRNRIVSGLADALVVVEARIKSGTLGTVDMALEQGRDVYVVPGRVTDRLSDGCNRLLKQGAGVFTDPESFLEELEKNSFLMKISPIKEKRKGMPLGRDSGDGWEQAMRKRPELPENLLALWQALDYEPRSTATIWEKVEDKLSLQQCCAGLMELVLMGEAKQVFPGHYSRM